MNPAKLLLIVAVVAAAAAGLWFVLDTGPAAPSRPVSAEPVDAPVDEPAAPDPEATSRITATPEPDPEPQRQRVAATNAAGADFDQGMEGRLVDEYGRPVAGAEVFLFEGTSGNPFASMLALSQGIVKPPLATTVSEADGRFRLGLREIPAGKTFDLRAQGPQHGDVVRPNLTLFDGRWWDAGDITMPTGLTVFGRVTEASTGRAIADATVYVRGGSNLMMAGSTPGRENGIEVRTDPTGQYRIENATTGVFNVGAVAPGFAQDEFLNVHIKTDTENRFDFELSPGVSIDGIVTDPAGEPIAGAKLTASAISSKKPMTQTATTDEQGRFELIGLVEGPFRITLNAAGFASGDQNPVIAPASEEHYVLERQGAVRVRVMAADNRQVRNYRLFVKSYHPSQDSIGNMPHMPVHKVDARDLDDRGFYVVNGLNPDNQYKVEIFANGYAKAFSEPFEIVRGGQDPEVVVTLDQGGSIRGVVYAENGEPLSGVEVKTLPNDFKDNAIMQMFGPMIPYTITRQSTKTDSQGRYELTRLMPEQYQIQFAHGDHYTVSINGCQVETGATVDMQPMQMRRGTVVVGSATVDGQPAAQVKVTVSAQADPDGTPADSGFSATVVTDAEGRFTLPKRLPPGRYMAQAGRQGGPNIFLMVLDYKQTQTEFTITDGELERRLDFRITSSPAMQKTGR